MRVLLLCLATLAATPVLAEDHDHHLAEAEGLRILHAWTPAAAKGADALIYMEIENTSATEAMLTGGEALGRALDLVGFSYSAAGESWAVLPGLPVPQGGEVDLMPKVLALRLADLPEALAEGEELEIEVEIGGQHVQTHAEITAANAGAHSHAGHNH